MYGVYEVPGCLVSALDSEIDSRPLAVFVPKMVSVLGA